jgi:SAM-dependent methyltransferase
MTISNIEREYVSDRRDRGMGSFKLMKARIRLDRHPEHPVTQQKHGRPVMKGLGQSMMAINFSNQEAKVALESKIKAGVTSLYEAAADWATKGDLWNWGLYDQEVAEEIEKLIPGFGLFDTDTYSEQLYMLTLRELPLPYEDYARKQVLEVGCGMGEGLNFLSRVTGAQRMVGLDLSHRAVDRANSSLSRLDTLSYVHGDAENLPFEDGEFDVVINVESSHNYPNLGRFIDEVARVLKPGGFFSHVDAFPARRLTEFHRIKAENTSLDWLQERDISEDVRAAIRRRIVPDSFARRAWEEKKKRIPSDVRGMFGPGGMRRYGAHFVGYRGPILYRLSNKVHRRPTPVLDLTYLLTTARKPLP